MWPFTFTSAPARIAALPPLATSTSPMESTTISARGFQSRIAGSPSSENWREFSARRLYEAVFLARRNASPIGNARPSSSCESKKRINGECSSALYVEYTVRVEPMNAATPPFSLSTAVTPILSTGASKGMKSQPTVTHSGMLVFENSLKSLRNNTFSCENWCSEP